MYDDYQLRKEVDRFKNIVDTIQTILETEYGVTEEVDINSLLSQFYDKADIDELIQPYFKREDVDARLIENYEELLETVENYYSYSEDKYTLFRGDCWTVNNNFESSASIVSDSDSDFSVVGTFRTESDLVGIYWNSQDLISHDYISYGSKYDYTGVVLDFDYEMNGCTDFATGDVVITIRTNSNQTFYLEMDRFVTSNHVCIAFNNLTLLPGYTYIDSDGSEVIVTEETPLDVTDISSIMLMLIPYNYTGNAPYVIMQNEGFYCNVSNISVTNGVICKEHIPLPPHQYRLCEGYDDFYDLNPRRVVKEMRKLGYVEWVDLYIGASHFYEKSGTVGDTIDVSGFNHTRTEKMVLDNRFGLNGAFETWLDCYSKTLKEYGTDKLIISVSMENLQCPTSWRQKTSNNKYAETEWVPSTFFYSPCNEDAIVYMQVVSQACLDIVTDNGLQAILQMGEAWWWWNEWYHPTDSGGNPIDVEHWQPPCFYDDATKAKYLQEFGTALPVYDSTADTFDEGVVTWLNQQLVAYSDALMEIVKSDRYDDGIYMALFFPPSVTDTDRVPEMMRKVNYITGAYNPSKLDIIQLEDYDWVTRESPHHNEIYQMGLDLGFRKEQIHYYGGFVQYPKDAVKFWRLIKTAMNTAIKTELGEVFVWAGTQIRRDNKIIGHDDYELIQKISEALTKTPAQNIWKKIDSNIAGVTIHVNESARLVMFYLSINSFEFTDSSTYYTVGTVPKKYVPSLPVLLSFSSMYQWGDVTKTGDVRIARNPSGTVRVRASAMWHY